MDTPALAAPVAISIGEKAWTCIPGTRRLTARTRSAYPVAGMAGSMPPCMQTSVAPSAQACSARSATWSRESRYASASRSRWAKAQKRQPT